jgi:hypothetical protein
MRTSVKWIAWGVIVVTAAALAGCGTSEYNGRLERKVEDLKKHSPFATLADPVPVPGSAITLRLPKDMRPVSDANLMKIPFTPDLGVKAAYEGSLADANANKKLYFCYVVVLPPAAANQDQTIVLLDSFKQKLGGGGGENAAVGWTSVNRPTPDGGSSAWKYARLSGHQEFVYRDKKDKLQPAAKEDGLVEIWTPGDAKGGGTMAIVWRIPKAIEGPERVNLGDLAPLVAGGVVAK